MGEYLPVEIAGYEVVTTATGARRISVDSEDADEARQRAERYMTERLDPAMRWHHAQASWARRVYFLLRWIQVGAAAAATVIATLTTQHPALATWSAIAAAVSLATTKLVDLSQPRQRWAQYLTTAEVLCSLRWRYTSSGRSDLEALIEAVENAITASATATSGRISQATDPR